MKEFTVGGKAIVVARAGGEVFAFGGECTHAGCALSGGTLEGTVVTCWCHGGAFDIRTGEVKSPPPDKKLPVYKVKVEGEEIWVEV